VLPGRCMGSCLARSLTYALNLVQRRPLTLTTCPSSLLARPVSRSFYPAAESGGLVLFLEGEGIAPQVMKAVMRMLVTASRNSFANRGDLTTENLAPRQQVAALKPDGPQAHFRPSDLTPSAAWIATQVCYP
jgi:hypothetical protein